MRVVFLHLLAMIVFNVILLSFIWDLPETTQVKPVPCYDRYSNEIAGQTCKETEEGMDAGHKMISTLILISFSLFFSIVITIVELVQIQNRNVKINK
jgi:hypothetical protein